MTVGVTGAIFEDIIQPPEMPQGLRTFWGQAEVTGTSGVSTATINFPFNPSAAVEFQQYVAICRMSFRNTVAQVTDAGEVLLTSEQWERAPSTTNQPVAVIPALVPAGDVNFMQSVQEFLYLGRITPGALGELRMVFQEVDTAVLRVMITGIISDRPFVCPEFWRV